MNFELLRDSGMQRERTALAWHRTIAGLFASNLVLLRLLPEVIGLVGTVAAGVGLIASVACAVLAERRVARVIALPWPAPREGRARRMPGGALLCLVCLLVTCDSLCGLAVILRHL